MFLLNGCEKQAEKPAPPPPAAASASTNYTVNGVIVSLLPERKQAIIRHEAITNYMEAMTMPFPVKDVSILQGLHTNDPVRFELTITETAGWISKIEKRKEAVPELDKPAQSKRDPLRVVREVEPLKVGDRMPEYPFTNELGKAINLKDFKGEALGLTFIYTRCPFPDFCPRMSSHFLKAQNLLKSDTNAPTNWRLLSVSFDTDYDTPATLLQYAKRYNYDPQRWSFVTGALIEIDAITEQFGLGFPFNADTRGFDHNLRTVVINAQGKVQKIFTGYAWTPEEFVEEMKKAARAGK